MAATADNYSTPINMLTRDNITVLIRNNVLNESVEFESECETMETDSPIRKPLTTLQPINKKLFHSPLPENPQTNEFRPEIRKKRKRKLTLIPNSNEKIKRAYVKECEKDVCSPGTREGMRKRVLISLFHNKECSMDLCD